MHGSRGEQGVRTPLENKKAIKYISNTSPDPLENHKATKPAFNVEPSSARQRNVISMAFRWLTDDARFNWHFDPLSPHQKQKKKTKKNTLPEFGHTDKTF